MKEGSGDHADLATGKPGNGKQDRNGSNTILSGGCVNNH